MNYYVLMGNRMLQKKKTVNSCGSHTMIILRVIIFVCYKKFDCQWARSSQPKFPEISVQKSMDRFGPTEKVSKKLVHLLRWTTFPGRTGLNFGWIDPVQCTSVYLARKYYSCTCNNIEYPKSCLPPGREHHFTCSSEQHEGLVICKAKPVPLYLRPWIYYIGSAFGIQPTTSSTLKSSTLPTELVLFGSALTQYNTISTLLTWL